MEAEQKKEFDFNDFKEFLVVIEEAAQRCKRITQSLLDFSNASKVQLQIVSLNESVENVVLSISQELSLQNITISKELDLGLPQIQGDPQFLEQVIHDLVINAKWAILQKSKQ